MEIKCVSQVRAGKHSEEQSAQEASDSASSSPSNLLPAQLYAWIVTVH